ncbi:MAG TPA: ArsR family transcriptional regulator [Ktedonosporobacter sp.]|jgi:protein-tyrosine-phosphatase|nr:ArsR family transcriptional regulator [Ktedonosporobacter sp.]
MDQAIVSPPLPDFLKLLAHELRWKILTRLARSDYNVAEIVRFLDQPQNVVSYHLRKLRDLHLVTERRSTADERSLYYSLDLETFRTLYLATGEAVHPAVGLVQALSPGAHRPVRVLFLCTENSARSQIAEGLLRHLSHGQVEAFSAGSAPSQVHPLASRVLQGLGADLSLHRSKHLDEFRGLSFDYIVTVCDRVREVCPSFPSDPERIHWSFLDPALVEGSDEERWHTFEQIALQLTTRIRHLLTLIAREQGARSPR